MPSKLCPQTSTTLGPVLAVASLRLQKNRTNLCNLPARRWFHVNKCETRRVVGRPVYRVKGGFAVLYQRDGHVIARQADASVSPAGDERIIENAFAANLRRAFPLPGDDQSAEDRFAVLLEALSRVGRRGG